MIYVPNVGEQEMLRAFLNQAELTLGLFSNAVQKDGSLTINGVTELLTGGGRGYAPKVLTGEAVEAALTASKWLLSINLSGSAEGQYSNAVQKWTMLDADVADAATIRGAFAFMWVLPFDAGAVEIKPGDEITGASSGATATATLVNKLSGAWGTTAAGLLWLKSKSGTFQDNENLLVSASPVAVSNSGVTNAGDAHKRLIFVDLFTDSYAVDTVGLTIEYTPKLSLASS